MIANKKTLPPPPTQARPSEIFEMLFGASQKTETPRLIPFFSDLLQFNQLSHLNLLLSTFYVSTQEFKQLSLVLKQLKLLSSLHLELPEFESKNNFEGLGSILSCVRELPKLTDLNLRFEGENVCDQQVGILSSHLAECQNLKSLHLDFKYPSDINSQSLDFLLVVIQNLSTLEDLGLLFSRGETLFRRRALNNFLEGLVVLKRLTSLSFSPSSFIYNSAPLPENLKEYRNLKQMRSFIVDNFRYI